VRIYFWGTRGSLPSPLDGAAVAAKIAAALRAVRDGKMVLGDDAAIDAVVAGLPFETGGTFGGNTSCVQIDAGDPEWTVCDAGSGLRAFGDAILARHREPQTYNLFLSHVHWDHIMGFPFFRPAYIPGNVIRIHGCHGGVAEAFARQHGAPSFPVDFEQLGATIEFVQLEPERTVRIGGFDVRAVAQRHPGDSFAYRFSTPDAAVVYATDAEYAFDSIDDAAPFIAHFKDADVAIIDAMYTLGEALYAKQDWGHSSNVAAVELARAAHVRQLVLFHHDPANDDAAIDRLLHDARRFEEITRAGTGLDVIAAYDGCELVVPEVEGNRRDVRI
jgi:phosphoribosyl 1,2-cyclic phosphodiesterase